MFLFFLNLNPILPDVPCSAPGQPKTCPAIRSGSIILSFTWCCGPPVGLEQLPPSHSIALQSESQVLQSLMDMIPRWIGGTCLTGLIEHGAVVTVQVSWVSLLPIG